MTSVSFGLWCATVLPIVVLAFCLVGLKLSMAKSACAALAVAVIYALLAAHTTWFNLGVDTAKGLWNTTNILCVIWPAIALYEVLRRVGAFSSIADSLTRLTQDQLILVILVGWVFAGFVQSITGFGIPVAVAAPLLVALGVDKIRAIIIPLLGHAWANSMGTLGLSFDAMLIQAHTPATPQILFYTGLYLGIVSFTGGVFAVLVADGLRGLKHAWPFVLLVGLGLAGGQFALCLVSYNVSALLPASLVMGACVLLLKAGFYTKPYHASCVNQDIHASDEPVAIPATMPVAGSPAARATRPVPLPLAVLGFVLLALFYALLLVFPSLKAVLAAPTWSLSFPQTVTGTGFTVEAISSYAPVSPLIHAGFVTLCIVGIISLAFGAFGFLGAKDVSPIARAVLSKASKTSLGIVLLVVLSQIMSGCGAMSVLAVGISQVSGKAFGTLSPFVGLLGAFMGSSNMTSNILFTTFQQQVATYLAIDPGAFLGAQTSSASAGVAIAPSVILLACITVGLFGKEGEILRRVLPFVLVQVIIMAIITQISILL